MGTILGQWFGGMALRAGIIAAVLGGVLAFHWNAKRLAYNEGYAAALAKIEEANREADRKADIGEDAVARCYRSGGRWMRQSGSCEQALRRPE